jgi:hypothetical protein
LAVPDKQERLVSGLTREDEDKGLRGVRSGSAITHAISLANSNLAIGKKIRDKKISAAVTEKTFSCPLSFCLGEF